MKEIADAGLIISALDSRDQHHAWAVEALRNHSPFYTCDAVLAESAAVTGAHLLVLQFVIQGDIILDRDFVLAKELARVTALAVKYQDQPLDIADACLLRMTELSERCRVWTVDRRDFSVYRRHGRQPVPCVFPPAD